MSAALGDSAFFVIEADEYDSAFLDKRSKFVHYRPRTAILNNLEFDHADIFEDLAAIQKQFHHLVRIIPSNGRVIVPAADKNLQQVLDMGLWSDVEQTSLIDSSAQWLAKANKADGSDFNVVFDGKTVGTVIWTNTGEHNINNALAAIAAARHVGVSPELAIEALAQFKGVKRRMELIFNSDGIRVYDDFAHHPSAIATTLAGLRAQVSAKAGEQRIIAVIEPRSNTMRLGSYLDQLADVTATADQVIWYQPEDLDWSLQTVVDKSQGGRS